MKPLLIGALAALALPACGSEDTTGPPPGTIFVIMGDNFFQPDTTAVPSGRSVRWTNRGAALHTVVSDSLLWQSALLQNGWWFEARFDSSGTFDYHCSQHPEMTGTVIVAP